MPLPRNRLLAFGAIPLVLLLAGGGIFANHRYEQHQVREQAEAMTGGNASRGRQLFSSYGCGGCHKVEGVPQAHGLVGPPLDGIANRAYLAGRLENRPDNLKRWIAEPQSVAPGTAMPDLPMGERDRRDLAAFLYTRR